MRFLFLLSALLFFLPARAEMPVSLPDPEDSVSVIALPGLVEAGDDEPNIDWVHDFETETGCHVELTNAADADKLMATAAAKDFDVVMAPGEAIDFLNRDHRLDEINPQLLGGFAGLDAELARAPTGGRNGQFFAVPLHWAPLMLIYDPAALSAAPGLQILFEPMSLISGGSNRGRIQPWGRPLNLAVAALYLRAKRPQLRIKDPFALNEAQYQAVLEAARAQKKLASKYWTTAEEQLSGLLSGKVVAALTWPLQIDVLAAKNRNFEVAPLSEGTIAWIDGAAISIAARHPGCAYRWIDHLLDPLTNGQIAAWYGSVPSVPAACDAVEALGKAGCRQHGADLVGKVEFQRLPEAACERQGVGDCVGYERWKADAKAIQSE